MGKSNWLQESGLVNNEPKTEEELRAEYIQDVYELCEAIELLEPPKGFPDEVSFKELQDFVWSWSEFTG